MREGIEERKEAQHPPEMAEPVPAGDFANRCHGKRQRDEDDGDQPGGMQYFFWRIGAELFLLGIPDQKSQRQ